MSGNDITVSELKSWVEKSLEDQNFSKYEITIAGKTEKGEGYMGEVVFAVVRGTTKDNERKVLNLVVKHGKKSDVLRETVPVRNIYEKEIYLYTKVFPAFKKFQLERNVKNGFNSVAKCYKTLLLDNMEVLILGNLRKLGYELHDRKKTLNIHHIKAVLIEYGKFHALSFAMRDQEKETFNAIDDHNHNILKEFFLEKSLMKSFQQITEEALDMLKERNDLVLVDKLEEVLVKESSAIILDLLEEKESQTVITHGDCWNNNFLFKYKNADRTCPSQIAILDWQVSALQSPAMDLTNFIYGNSSTEELDKFEELMETYYASFSSFLRELGSNPDELFTFSDLMRHWRKYSLYGLLYIPFLLRFALCDKEDAPSLDELKEGENLGSKLLINISDKDVYYERIKAITSHYFKYVA